MFFGEISSSENENGIKVEVITFFLYLFIADDCVVVFLPVSYDGHCLFPMVIEGIRGIIVKLGDDYML